MTFDIGLVISNTIAGILINSPWFVLVFLGFKMVSREIKVGVKKVPEWISQFYRLQMQQLNIERAVRSRA